MRLFKYFILPLVCLLAWPVTWAGPARVAIRAAEAPNLITSPSWGAWVGNALCEARSDGPDSFEHNAVVSPEGMIVTNFWSWMGQAQPGERVGTAYALESGNRLHWVTRVSAKGARLSIGDGLRLRLVDTDLFPGLHFDSTYTGFLGSPGMELVFGLDYGADGEACTGDEQVVMDSGAEVDEIVSLLPGLGFMVTAASGDPALQQAAINIAAADVAEHGIVHLQFCASFAGGAENCQQVVMNGRALGRGLRGGLQPALVAPTP